MLSQLSYSPPWRRLPGRPQEPPKRRRYLFLEHKKEKQTAASRQYAHIISELWILCLHPLLTISRRTESCKRILCFLPNPPALSHQKIRSRKVGRAARSLLAGRTTIYFPFPSRPKSALGRETVLFRKEVIQPQVLLQLPCYDFTPITNHTLGACPLAVSEATSSAACFRDVTGGVYKARERIHRSVLIRDY